MGNINNRDALQAIKVKLMTDNGWDAAQTILYIAKLLKPISVRTVWNWLSTGGQDIPDLKLELLRLKLKGEL